MASEQTKWANPVKEKLRRGEPVIGLVISINNAEIAAAGAALGFDFLWIEMEHAPISLETLRNMVLVTRGLPAVPFARPPVNELWTAKRLLDAGVLGVIFPFTRTAELAAASCGGVPLSARRTPRFRSGFSPGPLARTRRLL